MTGQRADSSPTTKSHCCCGEVSRVQKQSGACSLLLTLTTFVMLSFFVTY